MENWQLTLAILASVLIGALIPLLVMMAIAFYRVAREIAEVGTRLKRTLERVEIISERVEILSSGLKGGEADIADVLRTVGHLARSLEQNMNGVNIFAAILAAVGPVVAAYVKTWFQAKEPTKPIAPKVIPDTENELSASPSPASPEPVMGAH